MPPILGYWNVRGLAEPIRYLLAYTGIKCQYCDYVTGDGFLFSRDTEERLIHDEHIRCKTPGYDKSCWLSVKETLGLPFPNVVVEVTGDRKLKIGLVIPGRPRKLQGHVTQMLETLNRKRAKLIKFYRVTKFEVFSLPYYIDGDVKLTQTMAIIRYIARKHNLCGTTEEEMQRVDVIAGEAMDFIAGFIKFTYFSPDFEAGRAEYLNTCRGFLQRHSEFLANYPYFAGEHISYADFMMYDFLDQLRTFDPPALDPFKNVTDFMARIEAIPAIKEFLDSEYFRNRPISNKMAHWGTKPLSWQ